MNVHHPIRDAWIVSYQGDEDAIAVLITNKNPALSTAYPFGRGKTRAEAEANAEAWRQNVIDTYEAGFIKRIEARQTAAAAKARKTPKAA
jgi:hypothetical protein